MSRRWLQFSLRGFLLATTAFAVWLGLAAEKAMRQKEAVASLNDWGAEIVYDHQWQGPSKFPKLRASPPGWLWLRKLLGAHYFDKVVSVEIVGRQFTAAELAAAGKGTALALPRPRELNDTDFKALGHLPDLKQLKIISDLDVTQAGLRQLARLKQLETLILDNTSGRSSGGVTNASLAFVERMPQLTRLYLEGNHVTDDGLAHIRWPAGLSELDLSGTRITDAGLEHLKKIATLRSLVILDTRVTDAGVEELQKSLPNCQIRRHPW